MAIQTPSDDILVDGYNLYSFQASSAVSGGALVKPVGEYTVGHGTAISDNVIGIALYETAKGNMVTIAGPGCIVRGVASGSITYGQDLYTASTGRFHAGTTYGGLEACVGIALETIAESGSGRILLK